MECQVIIRFRVNEDQIERWESIVRGLAAEEAGAKFQERMQPFGKEVDEKLDAMMEEFPVEYFMAEQWKRQGDRFVFQMLTASDGDEFAEALEEVLELCGVHDLLIEVEEDDE